MDYIVQTVSTLGTPAFEGSAINESFDLHNQGTATGLETVYWTAYISTDTILDGSDPIIDSGSNAALAGSTTAAGISITGIWPEVSASTVYYIFVDVSGGPESNTGNNNNRSNAFTINPLDIDYTVTIVTNANTPASTGSAVSETFSIQNIGASGGSETVYWTAYKSTDGVMGGGGETVIDSGITPALGAGGTQAGIVITGTWYTSPGTYYLIVTVSASDENPTKTGNNNLASAAFTINAPQIDYVVTSVSNVNTPATAGSAISETFNLQNQGANNGAQTVYWTAYVSTDTALDIPGDTLIDSGSTGALNTGASTLGIAIDGTWPSSSGTRYIIVDVSSGDETVTGNNDTASGAFTIDPANIDYIVDSVSTVNTPALIGSTISESFTYRNQGIQNGATNVSWTAYASTDMTVDPGVDLIVDTGTEPALNATTTSGAIAVNGTWPSTSGTWYLLIRLSATDDTVTGNNDGTSGAFTLNLPDIDYRIESISHGSADPAATGAAFAETFTFRNYGTDPGSSGVNWYAYYSTKTTLDGSTEQLFDLGTTAPLPNGATSGSIPIDGTWPGTGGTYYIIVKVTATDETNTTNNTGASTSFTVLAPASIDYIVTSVTENYPSISTGDIVSEKFSIKNIGDTAGGMSVNWDARASADTVWDAGDTLINSGSLAALPSGGSTNNISIGGTWPGIPGNYYLVVQLTAADETDTTNNESYSGPFSVTDPPDYAIVSTTWPVVTEGGNSGELLSAAAGAHSFTIENQAAFAGDQVIQWEVWASTDQVYDTGDDLLDSGTNTPLDAFGQPGDQVTIGFDGNLPFPYGYRYLIIRIDAGDDSNPGNDTAVSGMIHVWEIDAVGTEDLDIDDDSFLSDAEDYAVKLQVGDTIFIDGTMDNYNLLDSFVITTGSGVTSIDMLLTWSTGVDDLDLYCFDVNGDPVPPPGSNPSQDTDPDREPGAGVWSRNVSGDSIYYISAYAYLNGGGSGSTGELYRLTITAN